MKVEPVLILTPQLNDANPSGDVFGGWLLSQLDIAGCIAATKKVKKKLATVAVKDMHFIQPIFVHDVVSLFAEIEKIGHTSITIKLDVYADRAWGKGKKNIHVAEARFVYVAIKKPGLKIKINR